MDGKRIRIKKRGTVLALVIWMLLTVCGGAFLQRMEAEAGTSSAMGTNGYVAGGATLTITESSSGSSFSTTKTITVIPRAADHIIVEMKNGKPEVSNGSPIDLANALKVINAYDSSSTIDGQFTYDSGKYTLSVPSGKGSIDRKSVV